MRMQPRTIVALTLAVILTGACVSLLCSGRHGYQTSAAPEVPDLTASASADDKFLASVNENLHPEQERRSPAVIQRIARVTVESIIGLNEPGQASRQDWLQVEPDTFVELMQQHAPDGL